MRRLVYVFCFLNRELKHQVKPIPNTFSNYSNDESYCCFSFKRLLASGNSNMAAIYSNGGNRWNILGFNFTKRDALSSVYKISMIRTAQLDPSSFRTKTGKVAKSHFQAKCLQIASH